MLTPGRVRAQVAQGENAEASLAWGCARSWSGDRAAPVCRAAQVSTVSEAPGFGAALPRSWRRAPPSIPRQAAREPRLHPAWQGGPSPRHVSYPVTHTRLHVMHALGQRLSVRAQAPRLRHPWVSELETEAPD